MKPLFTACVFVVLAAGLVVTAPAHAAAAGRQGGSVVRIPGHHDAAVTIVVRGMRKSKSGAT